MDDKLMNSYIDAMGSIGTDETSRTKLERAIARERKRATDTKACAVPRRRAMRIAAAAAAVGLIAVGSALVLPRLTGHNIPISPDPDLTGFVLTAYAEGEKVDGMDNAVMTSTDALMGLGSWSENDDGTYSLQYLIDPNCLGNDVVSIECRSTNENVKLEGSRDRRNVLSGESPGTPMLEAITVGGPNATLPDLYQLNLWVKAPATAEVIAAKNELHDLADQGSPTEDAWDRLSLEVERSAATELSSGTLDITATFEDGSTLTHSYRIAPADNFEEIWHRNEEAWMASFEEGAPKYEPEQLYILQQVN